MLFVLLLIGGGGLVRSLTFSLDFFSLQDLDGRGLLPALSGGVVSKLGSLGKRFV